MNLEQFNVGETKPVKIVFEDKSLSNSKQTAFLLDGVVYSYNEYKIFDLRELKVKDIHIKYENDLCKFDFKIKLDILKYKPLYQILVGATQDKKTYGENCLVKIDDSIKNDITFTTTLKNPNYNTNISLNNVGIAGYLGILVVGFFLSISILIYFYNKNKKFIK